MKTFPLLILLLSTPLIAQIPGYNSTVSASSAGTTLGANETTSYNGIALGNRVKLRGFVDFMFSHVDINELEDDQRFSTASDLDFLFDLSPVSAELHLKASADDGVGLEQVFGRYDFNTGFNITFGRQLTALGYEGDERTDLLSTSYGYFLDVVNDHPGLNPWLGEIADAYNNSFTPPLTAAHPDFQTADNILPSLRRNYVDGIRANFNNGQFGFSFGIHDGYWLDDDLNDNIAIDIAASIMIIPGLEARIGYAHQDTDEDMDVGHFNTWIAYNPDALTLAFEFDHFDFDGDSDLWDIMLMGNYQFTDFFGLTLRYTHEDGEDILGYADYDSDRITLALLFAITNNFGINVEYSHTEIDTNLGDGDADEFYIQGLINF